MTEPNQQTKGKKGGKAKFKRHTLPYCPSINPALCDDDIKHGVERCFSNNTPFTHDSGVQLDVDPFCVGLLPDLIKEDHFMNGLKDELIDMIFHEKNNDLYKFHQTDDFRKINKPHATAIRALLREQVLPWLRDVTGIPLNDKIDITCSRYDYTDALLCHDDELDTRRIAFVLYLVPPWRAQDGGALDLYSMDEHLQPKEIVKSILPKWNQLVWFEVTEASHHQVAEVMSEDKSRLSVNGWFHASPVPRAPRYIEPRAPTTPYLTDFKEDIFTDWINPIYLDPIVQSEIQEKFENDSEIELQEFLREDKYSAVKEALERSNITWQKRGPPNKRCYERASPTETLPEIILECIALLQSELFFLTLSNLTGLSLHPMAATSDSEDEEPGSGHVVDTGQSGSCCPSSDQSGNRSQNTHLAAISPLKNTNAENNVGDDSVEMREIPSPKKRKLNEENDKGDTTNNDSEKEARCRVELRHWQHGDYTLLHDTDSEGADYALDLMLHCNCPARRGSPRIYCCGELLASAEFLGMTKYILRPQVYLMLHYNCHEWEQEEGGYTSYIARGEDEELLTVVPAENSLALVYRDQQTLRFAKHINTRARHKHFYEFAGVYFE